MIARFSIPAGFNHYFMELLDLARDNNIGFKVASWNRFVIRAWPLLSLRVDDIELEGPGDIILALRTQLEASFATGGVQLLSSIEDQVEEIHYISSRLGEHGYAR